MTKRKGTKLGEIEPKIATMRQGGKSNREIAEAFGLEIRQIKQ